MFIKNMTELHNYNKHILLYKVIVQFLLLRKNVQSRH